MGRLGRMERAPKTSTSSQLSSGRFSALRSVAQSITSRDRSSDTAMNGRSLFGTYSCAIWGLCVSIEVAALYTRIGVRWLPLLLLIAGSVLHWRALGKYVRDSSDRVWR